MSLLLCQDSNFIRVELLDALDRGRLLGCQGSLLQERFDLLQPVCFGILLDVLEKSVLWNTCKRILDPSTMLDDLVREQLAMNLLSSSVLF